MVVQQIQQITKNILTFGANAYINKVYFGGAYMKLGTVVYDNKIYNLDYMTTEEMKDLLQKIEAYKKANIKETKDVLKNG